MTGERILIAEDEYIVAMGIKKMLKSLGYIVMGVASSGEDAVNKAESTFPDLVLIDIMLKGNMDGIEAAKEIIIKFDIPVIYLTGCTDNKVIERAWRTGPAGYILKPFDEIDLKKEISIAFNRHKMQKKALEKSRAKPQKNSAETRIPEDPGINS
jgi:DNA-binding NarL/FixJ family response regulator